MRSPYGNRFLSLLVLAAIVRVGTQADAQTSVPMTRQVPVAQRIIRQLDDPDPEIRKAASLQLNSLGADALEAINADLNDESISAESRARLAVAAKYVRPRAAFQLASRARVAWESRAFHEAYANSGNTDPKSDALVDSAIDLFTQLPVNPLTGPPELREKALAMFAAAAKAGADDPLFLALYSLAYGQVSGEHVGPLNENVSYVMFKFISENYPPAVKLRVVAGYLRLDKQARDVFETFAVKMMTEVAGAKDVPALELNIIGDMMYDADQASTSNLNGQWEPFLKAFELAAPGQPGPMIERARAIMQDAWDVRVRSVNEGNWGGQPEKVYADAMKQAADLLEAAWKLDPASSWASRNMVRLKMLQAFEQDKTKAREEMEQWFQRAISASPDDRVACNFKLKYLSPEWHGDFKQMIAFGRECLRSENWRGGIPMVLIAAHEAAANASDDRAAYFENAQVWRDIRDVYEGAVINFPTNVQYRCELAKYATLCGKWDIADAQFKKIGEKPVITVFGSEASYNYLRKKAARLVQENPKQENVKPPALY